MDGATRSVPGTVSSFSQFVLGLGMKESIEHAHFMMEDREEFYTDGLCSMMSLLNNCVAFSYSQRDRGQEWHLLVLECQQEGWVTLWDPECSGVNETD